MGRMIPPVTRHGIVLSPGQIACQPCRHIREDQLELFTRGQGLTMAEVIFVIDHLASCRECQTLLQTTQAFFSTLGSLQTHSGGGWVKDSNSVCGEAWKGG